MPRDPYIREKFTREHKAARQLIRDYRMKYPPEQY